MIDRIWEREFGFIMQYNGKKYMRRYQTFETESDLRKYISRTRPADCYVSVAYYDYPAQMRGWKGAELFFDFDSKENLKLAYADALTAYEVLLDDFALSGLQMNFTGAKGYHVLVYDSYPQKLNSRAREQIAEYLEVRYKVETLDKAASRDIKRLRRLEGTTNSKTGKICRKIKSSRRGDKF